MNDVSERLKMVRSHLRLGQQELSKRLSLGLNTWQRYELDGKLPKAETLVALVEMGFRADWLLTGQGPMLSTGGAGTKVREAVSSPIDEELHALVVDGVMAVYKEEGAGLPPRDLGRLAARIHGDLIAAYDDPDERKLALKLALQQLRRDLHAAPTADQGKRLA